MDAAKKDNSTNFLAFFKKMFGDRILQITIIITIISLFFARPRSGDMNWHTIESVATMLILIQIYSYLHVLDIIAYKLTAIADSTPHAYYFQQALNGLYAREAIICDVLGITLDDIRADKSYQRN